MNAADALFLSDQLGRLEPGYLADVIAIPFSGSSSKAAEAIVFHEGPVQLSLINGQQVYPRPSETSVQTECTLQPNAEGGSP